MSTARWRLWVSGGAYLFVGSGMDLSGICRQRVRASGVVLTGSAQPQNAFVILQMRLYFAALVWIE